MRRPSAKHKHRWSAWRDYAGGQYRICVRRRKANEVSRRGWVELGQRSPRIRSLVLQAAVTAAAPVGVGTLTECS